MAKVGGYIKVNDSFQLILVVARTACTSFLLPLSWGDGFYSIELMPGHSVPGCIQNLSAQNFNFLAQTVLC